MMLRLRQLTAGALVLLLLAVVGLTSFAPPALAQTSVVGSADFRNAPQLIPGTYSDRVVTGDSAWYSIIYSNGTPYDFEVAIPGGTPSGVDVTVSFVAPTLTTVDGPDAQVQGNGVVYPSGHTNVWFLKVSLESSGQPGVEYPVTISVSGVQSVGVAACEDVAGCTLDAEYLELSAQLADAEAELAEVGGLETEAAVSAEIENLRGFAESSATLLPGAQARLDRAEATMAQLCAPDPMCETFPNPGSKTPLYGWGIGLLAVAFGAYKAVDKLRSDGDEADQANAPAGTPPRGPSAIEKARREGAAKRKADKKAGKK